MGFTAADRKKYWAKKNAAAKNAPEKKPFAPLANPSEYQLAIFNEVSSSNQSIVIDAVAGSGKSTVLLNCLIRIPENLSTAIAAFGSDIAKEMKDKCPRPGVDIATTHSFAFRATRRRFKGIQVDEHKLIKKITAMFGETEDEVELERYEQLRKAVEAAKQCLAHNTSDVSDMLDKYEGLEFYTGTIATDKVDEIRDTFIADVIRLLDVCKSDSEFIDLTDMIWYPIIHNIGMDKFDVLFLDEVQDFNKCQLQLVLKMLKDNGRVIAAGDDRQAIFLWRMADVDSMSNLVKATNAKRMPLSVTYRCAKSIVEYTKKMVADLSHLEHAPNAIEGSVRSIKTEEMAGQIQPGDFVLSRVNAPLIKIAMKLIAAGIAANIRGKNLPGYFFFFIKNSKAKTIPEFLDYIDSYHTEQLNLLHERKKKPANIENIMETLQDKVNCMNMLAESCSSIKEMQNKIKDMFSETTSKKLVSLGSIHSAKGLQANNCFVLQKTLKIGKTIEESNLAYVCYTRAIDILYIVEDPAGE